MEIVLRKAGLDEAAVLHGMQIKAFMPLLEKYRDYETSPANESVDPIIARIEQPFTDYYLILAHEVAVGGIRVVKLDNRVYRVSPVFVLPEYQGRGIAQRVFATVERIYDDAKSWELDTILQEEGNCYLYEKLGYRRTGQTKAINEKMTIVFYEKKIRP